MTVASLTPVIRRFIELERKKADVKKYFDELSEALEAVVAENGINCYFQDPTDGTVYKLLTPEGKFVHFERFGYHRTKRGEEKRGDLSMKEAEEAGFKVK